jgi:hypothetical protein
MECGNFEHDGHTKVKIVDLSAESRVAVARAVDHAQSVANELAEAKVQLQACRGEVEATADASKQVVNAIAKRLRQAIAAAAAAVGVKVDGSANHKLGVGGAFDRRLFRLFWSRGLFCVSHLIG